ncbi:hypothetical protein AN1V17_10290 [Vallitalea sediminicola]
MKKEYSVTHENVYDNNIFLWNKDYRLKYNLEQIQKDFSKGKKLNTFFLGEYHTRICKYRA